MKTDFAILWIDDNKDAVDVLRPQLSAWIDKTYGFGLDIQYRKNAVGIVKELKTSDVELIVLDYHLGKKNGDTLIGEIREAGFFHDIIFYSQGGGHRDAFLSAPDGIFFVDRQDARERIKNLIALKVKPASDLATFRGWVVADSIELEELLGRVISKCFGEKRELFEKRILDREGLFDFYKKQQVLSGILKDLPASAPKRTAESLAKIASCKKLIDAFPDEIIHVRNAIAHQRVESTEGKKKIVTKGKGEHKEIDVTPEKFASIRKAIRKHRDNLLELDKLI